MKLQKRFRFKLSVLSALWILAGATVAFPCHAVGQTGYNAICNSTSACSGTGISASWASVDATAFCHTAGSCAAYPTDDFCIVVNSALHALPLTGGVVDARGINSGGSNTCGTASTPFTGTYTITTPSSVLLPSGTITIHQTWILPDRTRIIGQGNNPQGGTQIQAASTFATGSAMIQMGNSTLCADPSMSGQCYGVSIEDVFLSGSGLTINGIVNSNAGQSSYVDHVNFFKIEGIGLQICGVPGTSCLAQGSGPYSNLAFSASTLYNSGTECILLAASSTKGLHGVTCTVVSSGTAPYAGIQLDSSDNSIEDVHFEGYQDGIRIGWDGVAQGDVLLNINGGAGKDSMTNVIHICGSTTLSSPFVPCSTSFTVSDLTIEGAIASATSPFNVTNVLEDDITKTIVPRASSPETSMARYILGDSFGGGYSRFTTTPILNTSSPPEPAPAWGVGSSSPSASCSSGSLFSYPAGGSGSTLWVCKNGSWIDVK